MKFFLPFASTSRLALAWPAWGPSAGDIVTHMGLSLSQPLIHDPSPLPRFCPLPDKRGKKRVLDWAASAWLGWGPSRWLSLDGATTCEVRPQVPCVFRFPVWLVHGTRPALHLPHCLPGTVPS